jgi:hypothetical protein
MTTTYSIVPLSGSPGDFRGIKVTTTAIAGDTIHTAQASASLPDLMSIDICNTDTAARPFTLQWGGTTSPDDKIVGVVLAGATERIVTQKPIRNALVVKCFSGTLTWVDGVSYTGAANVLVVHGHVQRQLT